MHPLARGYGFAIGGVLVALGIAEVVRLLVTGDGGLWFWLPTLVGGGAAVLAGTAVLPRQPTRGLVLTTAGAVAAILPTAWTVVGPVLLLALVVVSAREASRMRRDSAGAPQD